MTAWRGIMGEVAEKCGNTVAIALMEKLGGATIYVPKKYLGTGPLAAVGKDLAEPLIEIYGGQTINVPSKLATRRPPPESHFGKIEALIDKGLTTAQVAARLGISQTYVFQIRRRVGAPKIAQKVDPRQKSLFD